MKLFALVPLLLCCGLGAILQGAPVALTGLRLINGTGSAPVDNMTIVVDNRRILLVAPDFAHLPEGTQSFDYRGKIAMPGLISDHSHVGVIKGITSSSENYTRENILATLKTYEAYGVTTVMALGLNGGLFQEIRQEAHAGKIEGADVFGVDRGIGVPHGAPPEGMLKVSSDQLFRPSTPEEARADVRAMKARGTDLVKMWLDDFGGSVPVKMKPEVYQAVIDEAHQQGLRVASHIHDLEDARAVVKAGVDILAHGVRDQLIDDGLMNEIKQRGVWYIPTLALDEGTFVYADQAPWTQDAFTQKGLSPELKARFADPAWRKKILSDPKTAAARKSLEINLKNLKRLYDAGVKIGFGTDSGAAPERVAGVAEHRELALMVQAGLTPLQAIQLATSNAAKLLGLNDRGTLATGQRADFIVLNADPSARIENSESIQEVWHNGKKYTP